MKEKKPSQSTVNKKRAHQVLEVKLNFKPPIYPKFLKEKRPKQM